MQNWTHPRNVKTRLEARHAPAHPHVVPLMVDIAPDTKPTMRPKYQGRVFVVDDQNTGRRILKSLLQQQDRSLEVRCFSDPHKALQAIHVSPPDLILTDYKMPQMDGVAFTLAVRALRTCVDVPLVVITACEDRNVRYQALEAGATDFIIRPIDRYECQARFKNLLTLRKQQLIIKSRAHWLEDQVAIATRQVCAREREALMCLARVAEYHSMQSKLGVARMSYFTRMLAEALGMPEVFCHEMELAAPLHDIGNIAVEVAILNKNTYLTENEIQRMQSHTTLGYQLLKNNLSNYMQLAAQIALFHHERCDGSGYPQGLHAAEIPLSASIVAVVDVFNALISDRPYKKAWSVGEALRYLKVYAGRHFDPQCVAAFLQRDKEIIRYIDSSV